MLPANPVSPWSTSSGSGWKDPAAEILLVIPAFNEGRRLAAFLPRLCETISAAGPGISVLVVDDGSLPSESAAMRAAVESLRPSHPFLLPTLALTQNLGKGGAVYAGWDTSSRAEWLGFIDADGAVPAAEAVRFAEMARGSTDTDGLFANRVHTLGRPVERTFTRHLAGRIYATLSANLTGIPVYDSQCGLKFVRRSCYLRIRPSLSEKRFGFDMELIALLHRAGCRLREEPLASWRDIPGGKVHLVRDSLHMFTSLLSLRRKLRQTPF